MSRIIERNNDSHLAVEIDSGCKNKFRWEWLECLVELNGKQVALSQFMRKIDSAGKCKCILCEKVIAYGSRGRVALVEHCQSSDHLKNMKTVSTNQKLPSSFTGKVDNSDSYGIHPFFKNMKKPEVPTETQPCVSYEDRVASAQAMVLGVIAEHSLPMTMAPVLVNLAKELSKDKKVLDELSMDRTSASYKMRYGVGKTMNMDLISQMKNSKFSLNLDETTSANNKHIVTVLVNLFSERENKVILEQLTSKELISVNSESLFEILVDQFESHDIPWTNLVSVLMDSCAVMRGCKTGLETRLRQDKAPHLLDIDGDLCHHMHNGCKKFCEPFQTWVEKLFNLLHADFKFSTDLREALSELCQILGIRYTVPERFLSHRWLSAYDVSVSTLRLWDAYRVFYYAFIDKKTKAAYWPVVSQILKKRNVDAPGKSRVKTIIHTIRKKNMTVDGKNRKQAIVEKVMFQEEKTLLILHFYTAVLPILKNYVQQFQTKEPLIHLLYENQEKAFRKFLSCYVKPEEFSALTGRGLQTMNLESDTGQFLDQSDMFIGPAATSIIIDKKRDDPVVKEFMVRASAAYITTGTYLQKKLPLRNEVLRRISSISPAARGTSIALKRMKRLPEAIKGMFSQNEKDQFDTEVHSYHSSTNLPVVTETTRLDCWWGEVSKSGAFPALSSVALAICTIFHGPLVEASFNTMGDILDAKSSSLGIETYSAYQTVKYHLKTREKTAIEYFRRSDFLYSEVNSVLCANIRSASATYRSILKDRNSESSVKKVVSKAQDCRRMRENAVQSQALHEKQQKKEGRKRLLEELVMKRKCAK